MSDMTRVGGMWRGTPVPMRWGRAPRPWVVPRSVQPLSLQPRRRSTGMSRRTSTPRTIVVNHRFVSPTGGKWDPPSEIDERLESARRNYRAAAERTKALEWYNDRTYLGRPREWIDYSK